MPIVLTLCLLLGLRSAFASVDMEVAYWIDQYGDTPRAEIADKPFTYTQQRFSLGAQPKVAWVRLIISNTSGEPATRTLHNKLPFFSHSIELYDGNVIGRYSLSDPANGDQLSGSSLTYSLTIAPQSTRILYLRNESLYTQVFWFRLLEPADSLQALINKNDIPMLLIVTLGALALYNLALFAFGNGRALAWYGLYLINAAVGLAYMYGLIYHNLGIHSPWVQWLNITALLVPLFLAQFIRSALDTRDNALADGLLTVVMGLSASTVAIAFVFDLGTAMRLGMGSFLISFLVVVYISYDYQVRKHPLIGIFIPAYAIYILGMSTTIAALFGAIELTSLSYYASGIALVAEALLFAYLLRYRTLLIEHERDQLRERADQLEHLAHHDPLTHLPNRRLFTELASTQLAAARRRQQTLAMLYLDLDGFKQINDQLGHHAGDQLLQHMASQLLTTLREADIVARLGGDEFAILLAGPTSCGDANAVADNLLEQLAAPVEIAGERIAPKASIGISLLPDHGENVETLLLQADAAMYRAKRGGKGRWVSCAVAG